MNKFKLVLLLCTFSLLQISLLSAQKTFPQNGVYDQREGLYAFINATIFTAYNQKIENASLLIRDGKVEAVGKKITIPEDAVIVDAEGKYIYPSFIDMYASYGLPKVKPVSRVGRSSRKPQPLSKKEGAYSWNQALKPEFEAYEHFKVDKKAADVFRKQGFGLVLTHQKDGISRGTSTLVTLGKGRAHELIIKEKSAHHLSFNKGTSTQSNPSSLMGSIALLRQTYLDGEWYKGQEKEVNLSLDAWNENQDLLQIFEVRDHLEALRASKIADEFGKKYIIKGNGAEYRRLDAIKATNQAFILPLNFPTAFDVEDPYNALIVSLAQLKHWELAPENPAKLANAGVSIAFTMDGLKKKSDFLKMLRKAVENGLSNEQALKALTFTPANLLGVYEEVGSLEKGKLANFIITDGDVFADKTNIFHNWVNGKPNVFKELSKAFVEGKYDLKLDSKTYNLRVSDKAEMKIVINDSTSVKIKSSIHKNIVSLTFSLPGDENKLRLSGLIEDEKWSGRGQNTSGSWLNWEANFKEANKSKKGKKKKEKETKKPSKSGAVLYPFVAHGWETAPQAKTYLIQNATVWTNENEGILKNTDVLIENGKIAQVGKGLKTKGRQVIDGKGKHLTAGIIDEHTHIAVSRGVNEGSQASSAEVRIGDVIYSEDINIYRQLAGGVTTAQILHGSANPIGGQSGLIKLRWGYEPEQMKFEGADGFIKFALGENVKQSNWGNNFRSRFPQTRMGVEQVFVDHFTRAREYGIKKSSGKAYRKDLEMETLLEILNKKRFITCHSYRQSEINMLMKVAEQFDFRVNTFTHILEGYKVAGQMKEHGVAASTFSDWWAYKHEVLEAIPYNAAIMHKQGVTVAINSDDAEMGRRLNQEAGKTVLYGNVSEEEALKFVTLNPAKVLHVDDRVGSIKVGKDADLVLWSDHPLSIYAKAEKTFVDGIKFFDREEDKEKRKEIIKERNRIIQKMLAKKQAGGKTRPVAGKKGHREYHCDDLGEE